MAFPGTGKIWMNGTLVDWKDAKIHVASHVVHYGSAVFEGARCYETPRGPACFRLDAHMRRLFDSARIYRMEPSFDQQTLTDAVIDLIKVNQFSDKRGPPRSNQCLSLPHPEKRPWAFVQKSVR